MVRYSAGNCTVAIFIDPCKMCSEHIYTHRIMRLLCNSGAHSGDCFLKCKTFVPSNYFAILGSILHPWHCSAPWKAAKEGGQWWPLPVIGTNFLIRSLPPPSPCLALVTPNFFSLYLSQFELQPYLIHTRCTLLNSKTVAIYTWEGFKIILSKSP